MDEVEMVLYKFLQLSLYKLDVFNKNNHLAKEFWNGINISCKG